MALVYGTDEGFAAYLAALGYTLPVDAPAPAILRARGSAYLDSTYDGLWTGRRTGGVMQADGWPRTGARIHCTAPIADDVIPIAIVNASYRAAWLDASNPGVLAASATSGQRVAREKVDVIEVAYHNDGQATAGTGGVAFVDGEIDGVMRAFICQDDGKGLFFASVGS